MRNTSLVALLSASILAGLSGCYVEPGLQEGTASPGAPTPIADARNLGDDSLSPQIGATPQSDAVGAPGMRETGAAGSTTDSITGAIQFFTVTGGNPSGAFARNAVQLADLPYLWLRVTVSDMPQLALRKIVFTDPAGQVYLNDDTWYSTSATFTEIPGALTGPAPVELAHPAGTSFDLDKGIPLIHSTRPPAAGMWHVRAWLDNYPGSIEATLLVRP